MERVLTDKEQFPTKEIIYSHIGRTRNLWDSLFDYIHNEHPGFTEQWRYYNDGKSWLMKVSRKSKTIFWLSVIKNSFRTTFYLPGKAEEVIMKSDIPAELKKKFKDGKRINKIVGITIIYKNKKDVDYVKSLIDIKLNIK